MRKLALAALYTSFGTLAAIAFGAVTAKILALTLGAAGIGLYGVLRQFVQTGVLAGSLNSDIAVVQGIASRSEEEQRAFVRLSVTIVFSAGAFVAVTVAALAPWLARWVAGTQDPNVVIAVRWAAAAILLGVLFSYLLDLLTAFRSLRHRATMQIVTAVTMAAAAYPVARAVLAGATYMLVLLPAAGYAFGILFGLSSVRRSAPGLMTGVLPRFDPRPAGDFLQLCAVLLATNLLGSFTVLALRALAVRAGGMPAAGFFDAAWTVTIGYTSLVLMTFQVYYIPELAALQHAAARSAAILQMLRFACFLSLPLIVAIIAVKPFVITFLYSQDFLPTLRMMRWVLIADYLKISAWVLGGPMLAYGEKWTFFWSELVSNAVLIAICYALLRAGFDFESAGIAVLGMYAGYTLFVLVYARMRHHLRFDPRTTLTWIAGLVMVLAASFGTWSDTDLRGRSIALWIVFAAVTAWLLLPRSERQELLALAKGSSEPAR
jgi:O-antigen/teichoic acid export membrane protein